jgi:hypothetical protein
MGTVINVLLKKMDFCLLVSFFLGIAAADAEDVSREAPELYQKELAGLMTPTKEIIALSKEATDIHDSGAILLDERIHYLSADGRRFQVRQVAYKTLTQAAVEENSQDLFQYHKKFQKCHILTAETIQEDGTIQPVKSDAILLQSPQRNADYSLYDDQAEVHLIYPNVKPGAITHAIVIIEDIRATMPNEYAFTLTWGKGWPHQKIRFLVDLPLEMATRLKINTLGQGLPAPTEEKVGGPRRRLQWIRTRIPGNSPETNPAPADQIGPVLRLSTLADWNTMGLWYNRLLKGRDELSPELKKQVDKWVANKEKPEEIIPILLDKAANEVRYTGLELGESDFQPHTCQDVWDNQYGDCKDKANLLVAWLRYKGIPARLTLLNTENAGKIDRRSPDYQAFTHAIVAIPDKTKGFLFCDPTIRRAQPGLLSPYDADRDVFIISEEGGDWARTPLQDLGTLDYRFELKMAASGDLSGWVTLESQGYFGISLLSQYEKLSTDETREHLTNLVQSFYPGAQVIDVVRADTLAANRTHTVKAYFLVPGQTDSNGEKQTLLFPRTETLLSDLGSSPRRKSDYFSFQEKTIVSCLLTLPPGLAPSELPKPFEVTLPSGKMSAAWRFKDSICQMNLLIQSNRSTLNPEAFTLYYNATQGLKTWLTRGVLLSTNGTSEAPSSPTTPLADFPLMPTGTGQIILLDKLYPETGDQDLRRAALEKTLSYFPQDKLTVFRTKVRLAIVDWDRNKPKEALAVLEPVLISFKGKIDPEVYAWGEEIQACVLHDLKRDPEAIAVLHVSATNENLTPYRRAHAMLKEAPLLGEKEPAKALALLETALPWDTEIQTELYALWIQLSLAQNQKENVVKKLEVFLQNKSPTAEKFLMEIIEVSKDWPKPQNIGDRETLLTVITKLVPEPGQALQDALDESRAAIATIQSSQQIQQKLKIALTQKPLVDWYQPATKQNLKSLEDFKRAIVKAAADGNADLCLHLSVESLATLSPGEEFDQRLWKAATYADWKERQAEKALDEPIFLKLLELCGQLPPNCGSYAEGKFLLARHLARKGDLAGERSIYQALIQNTQLSKAFLPSAYQRLGESYENAKEYPAALTAYKELEQWANTYPDTADYLLRALFINLHQDKIKEALRLLDLMASIENKLLQKAEYTVQIGELIDLYRQNRAEAYWTETAKWQKQWQTLATAVGLSSTDLEIVTPVISNLSELGTQVATAVKNNDRSTFYKIYSLAVNAARWQPRMVLEIASLGKYLGQLSDEQMTEIRKFHITLLETTAAGGLGEDRTRNLWLTANDIDAGHPQKALEVLTAFMAKPAPSDGITQALHRLFGLAAMGTQHNPKEVAQATQAIETDLKNPDLSPRISSVNILADLYRTQGQTGQAEALLRRELEHPQIKADAAASQALAAKLKQFDDGATFSQQVVTWLAASKFAWYDFAEPKDLHDPRLANLSSILNSDRPPLTVPEMLKLRLLVASDAGESIDTRRQAFNGAIQTLLDVSSTEKEAHKILQSVIDPDNFDEGTRVYWLIMAAVDAAFHNNETNFQHWTTHALAVKFTPAQKESLMSLSRFVSLDVNSPQKLTVFANRLLEAPIDFVTLGQLKGVHGFLLFNGAVDQAEALTAKMASCDLAVTVNETKPTLQLNFTRDNSRVKVIAPVIAKLRELVLAAPLDIPTSKPETVTESRHWPQILPLSDAETLQACLYMIKTGTFDRTNFDIWSSLLHALPPTDKNRDLGSQIIQTMLTQAPNDTWRAEAVMFAIGAFDWDDSERRQFLQQAFSAYRSSTEHPLTSTCIRLQENHIALRTGQALNFETAYSGLNDPRVGQDRLYNSLKHDLQVRDVPALKRSIENLEANQFLHRGMIRLIIPALDLLQMKTEAELARQTAQNELKRELIKSWLTHDPSSIQHVLNFTRVAGNAQSLPPTWVAEMAQKVGDPMDQHKIRLLDFWMRQDWKGVVEEGEQLNKLYPKYYEYYWFTGFGLHQLGKKNESVVPLKLFTQYCKDELDYPQAVTLLKEMGKMDQ